VVRDAIANTVGEGRSKLDEVRAGRRRQEAVAELGEIVLGLIRDGEIDIAELPEAQALVRQLDELDAAEGVADEPAGARPPRSRFDERGSKHAPASDDGTVSSGRWTRPTQRIRPAHVWRPPGVEAAADPDDPADPLPSTAPAAPGQKSLPRDPHRKGGIQFDNDDDLADYMHPDDVPAKPPTEGDA